MAAELVMGIHRTGPEAPYGEPLSASDAYDELRRSVGDAARLIARINNETFPGVVEELDDLVITVARTARRGLYGSFTPSCWRHGDRLVPEIFVNPAGFGGEVGRDLAIQTFDTIAHEIAHFINHLQGVQGSSRGGQWHNKRWAEVAIELGLVVLRDNRRGHVSVGVRDGHLDVYADALHDLEHALVLTWSPVQRHRALISELPTATEVLVQVDPSPSAKYVAAACRCADDHGKRRTIRVAAGWWPRGPITCGTCGMDFAPNVGVSDIGLSTGEGGAPLT